MVLNSLMLYLLASVDHYRQLNLVEQELLQQIERELSSTVSLYGYERVYSKEGITIFAVGKEHSVDLRKVLEFAGALFRTLEGRREELYGFNLLLAGSEQHSPEGVADSLRKQLLALEEGEELWVTEQVYPLLSELTQATPAGSFYRLPHAAAPQEAAGAKERELAWKRSPAVEETLRAIKSQVRGRGSGRGLVLYGPVRWERVFLLDALERRLLAGSAVARVPRLYTLYKRRSSLHPFLNSIDVPFLHHVSQYLSSIERQSWDTHAVLLWRLRPPAGSVEGAFFLWPKGVPRSVRPAPDSPEAGGPALCGAICADHLPQDFYLAFRLYLTAYFRMMEENFLPQVLFCQDVHSYQGGTLKSLATLLKDFEPNPSFLPVFTSTLARLPEELGSWGQEAVPMAPLRLKAAVRLAATLYPGSAIPQGAVSRLRSYSRGKLLPFYQGLRFLEARSELRPEGEGYTWEESQPLEQQLPPRHSALGWALVEALPVAARRLLYIVYLQSGLLDLWGLVAFLQQEGYLQADALRFLRELEGAGLVHLSNHAVPVFASFRKRLRRAVLDQDPGLEERLVSHLIQRWRAGEYPHLVLLFFLLAKTKRSAEGFEVLQELLGQKLDELDFPGAAFFLEPRNLKLSAGLSEEMRKDLELLSAAARLRHALLTGRKKTAEELYLRATELGGDYRVHPAKGELFLQVARYLLVRGEASMAMQWAKKAMFQFQSFGFPSGEREATVEMGSVLLAGGKFDEALEYFVLADQYPGSLETLQGGLCFALRGLTLFVSGNLSRARAEVEKGLALSGKLLRREWELFLEFLLGRVLFELGYYQEAVVRFQKALAVEALYENLSARRVISTWLGRAFAYQGSTATGFRVLREVEDSWEKHFFLAESHFFAGEYERALEACSRAIALERPAGRYPGERVLWLDGLWDIEGRCHALSRDGSLQHRLAQSFQAYLWALEGSTERAIEQLYSITRGGGLTDEDPYQSRYSYFYACTLPEVRKDELDDSVTILNKALKMLQQRASRIEDSTERWRYLNNNYWNGLLFAEARRKKMI
jgi:tetratricopeptide (TPR) repeat protein